MKVSLPEPVAAGILAALADSQHPDVRHLVREVRERLGNGAGLISSIEWGEVMEAIDWRLIDVRPTEGTKLLLRGVRPKIDKLRKRQQLREAEEE